MINGIKPKVKPKDQWEERDRRMEDCPYDLFEQVLLLHKEFREDHPYDNEENEYPDSLDQQHILKDKTNKTGKLGKEIRGNYFLSRFVSVLDYRDGKILVGNGEMDHRLRGSSGWKDKPTLHPYLPSYVTIPKKGDEFFNGYGYVPDYDQETLVIFKGGKWVDPKYIRPKHSRETIMLEIKDCSDEISSKSNWMDRQQKELDQLRFDLGSLKEELFVFDILFDNNQKEV